MQHQPSRDDDASQPAGQPRPYEVISGRLDQFAVHRFMQTLKQHAGTTRQIDGPSPVRAPHYFAEQS